MNKEERKEYRQEHKEERKKYRDEHKEEIKERDKKYYQEHKETNKEYYQQHKEEIKEESKKRYQQHKEEIKEERKEYYQEHKEERKEERKERYQKNKEEYYSPEYIEYKNEVWQDRYKTDAKFRLSYKKHRDKRQRNLGYNPLNDYFENSNGHHINKLDVIYIPASWHFPGHSVVRKYNMEPVNTVAFFFLTMQNIKELNLMFFINEIYKVSNKQLVKWYKHD